MEEISTNTKYLITVNIEPLSNIDTFIVGIYNEKEEEIVNSGNYSDFLAQYGDVVFTFKDVTGIELPE